MIDKSNTLNTFNAYLMAFTGMSLNGITSSLMNVKELPDEKLKELLREESCEMPSAKLDTRRMILLQEAIDRGIPLDDLCDLKEGN